MPTMEEVAGEGGSGGAGERADHVHRSADGAGMPSADIAQAAQAVAMFRSLQKNAALSKKHNAHTPPAQGTKNVLAAANDNPTTPTRRRPHFRLFQRRTIKMS